MIHNLKPYPAYKDSDVPWLGQVPEHWEVKRNKLFMKEINDRSKDGTEELLTVSQYTGVTRRREKLSEEGELLTNAASLVGYKHVMPKDLVMNIMLAWNGSLGVSPIEGIVSPAYCVYRSEPSIEPRFLHYFFRTPLYTGVFKTESTGVVDSRLRLYPEVFFRLQSLIPPIEEQSTIVRYLDYMDRRIRRYIHAKQKLIKLLEEQKQAIIHRAVTRGLNSNVKLKPSGVEWLGNVPEHWEVVKLGFKFRCTSGSTPSRNSSDYFGGSIAWIRTGELVDCEIYEAQERITAKAIEECSMKVLPVDTLLIAMYGQGQTRGRTGLLKIEAAINQACFAILPNPQVTHPKYFQYWFISQYSQLRNISDSRNATQPNLNGQMIKDQRILLPPLIEQLYIIENIQNSTQQINITIKNNLKEIALLREYRIRLIADVVTGKLDVREAAANLSDEVEEPEVLEDEEITEVDSEGELEENIGED